MRSARLFAVAVLAVVLALSSAQNAFASTEIMYDNGNNVAGCALTKIDGILGNTYAVLFSLPDGWDGATLSGAEVWVWQGFSVVLHVESSPGLDDLMPALPIALAGGGWHTYPLTATKITGAFYIAVEDASGGVGRIGGASGSDHTHSYWGPVAGPWSTELSCRTIAGSTSKYYPIMIRALEDPIVPPAPVGGIVMPANNFVTVAPWLAIVGLIGCVGTVVVVAKKRRP